MTLITEVVSKKSLDSRNQQKAYLLRTVHKRPYKSIAQVVVNGQGQHPCWATVRNICETFLREEGPKAVQLPQVRPEGMEAHAIRAALCAPETHQAAGHTGGHVVVPGRGGGTREGCHP